MNRGVGQSKRQNGFTIVELATVILVIGILAAIVIIGYNGIQQQARDGTRLSDMKTIGKALEIYKSRNGAYPPRATAATSWASSHEYPTDYINGLAGNGMTMKNLPVDPVNNLTYRYVYYVYPRGSYNCDPNLGSFYVLFIPHMETMPDNTAHPDSPGFSCPGVGGRDWATESGGAAWVQGGFVNG